MHSYQAGKFPCTYIGTLILYTVDARYMFSFNMHAFTIYIHIYILHEKYTWLLLIELYNMLVILRVANF